MTYILIFGGKSWIQKRKKIFPKDFINKFLCGDTVQILKQIPNESLDLAITSPPYNIKNSTGNGLKDGRGGKWASAALIEGYAYLPETKRKINYHSFH